MFMLSVIARTTHTRRWRHLFSASLALGTFAACENPLASSADQANFEATVSGSVNTTLRGSLSTSSDYSRQTSGGVTAPTGEVHRYIALTTSDGANAITFSAQQSPTLGEHRIVLAGSTPATGSFNGTYMQRFATDVRFTGADSGKITFTSIGATIKGSFVLYASKYVVLPILSGGNGTFRKVTPTGHGTSAVKITGTFDATVRRP